MLHRWLAAAVPAKRAGTALQLLARHTAQCRHMSTQAEAASPIEFKTLQVSSHIHTKLHRVNPAIRMPAPVQAAAIPAILDHRRPDVLIQSPAGTGKTLAYLLPLLSTIDPKQSTLQAIIVVPTRELAKQVETVARPLVAGGSSSYRAQPIHVMRVCTRPNSAMARAIEHKPPHVLVGTAHCLAHLVSVGALDVLSVKMLVLDEVGTLLEPFMAPLTGALVADHKDIAARTGRQLIAVGAYVPPSVETYLANHSTSLQHIAMDGPSRLRPDQSVNALRALPKHTTHYVLHTFKPTPTDAQGKARLLRQVLSAFQPKGSVLAYVNKSDVLEATANNMRIHNYTCSALHNQTKAARRQGILDQVGKHRGKPSGMAWATPVLLSTEMTSYGLHLDALSHVVNIDHPRDRMSYALRAGRVGRLRRLEPAGEGQEANMVHAEGTVVTIMPPDATLLDRAVSWLRDLNISPVHVKLVGGKIVPLDGSDYGQVWNRQRAGGRASQVEVTGEDVARLVETGVPPSA
eukprot:comp23273_c1_seq1/m.38094 comp23273_c1_seq1/g.38094  ORF comp23273_c1_seq1/g.38094 comp23273_c1_seq1/m.38094 type:complete len:518 (-) comp23273_c1_seq1:166-1719(-)